MRNLFERVFRAFEKALGEDKYLERRQLSYKDLVENAKPMQQQFVKVA